MGTSDDSFTATGSLAGNLIGFNTGLVTDLSLFDEGGRFQGGTYGTYCWGGAYPGVNQPGPPNSYSKSAGLFGQSIFVTGVAGASTNNVGVYGQTEDPSVVPGGLLAGVIGTGNIQPGVMGWSRSGDGVQGATYTGAAIRGWSFYGPAVYALSGGQNGVTGVSDTEGPPVPFYSPAGVVGTSDSQVGVLGSSNENVGVVGFSNNIGVVGWSTNPASFAGYFHGNVFTESNFTARLNSAAVPFPDGSQRLLHCMESPEHWFEDFGGAKLKGGRAKIKLDINFAKVIKRGDYRVFVTPEGDCHGLYVRHRGASAFEVRELNGGKSNITFSYRIVGRRKDIKGHRRFAKIDTRLPLPTARHLPGERAPTAAGFRAFVAKVEKQARERRPKGVGKATARRPRKNPSSSISVKPKLTV
jgi:hypothetical protein